jgi:hypothetical protein
MKIWQSFVVMFASILLGLICSVCYGIAADQMYNAMVNAQVYNVPDPWNPHSLVMFCLWLMYVCIYLIPILGITIFIITCTHRQRYDTYTGEEESFMEF